MFSERRQIVAFGMVFEKGKMACPGRPEGLLSLPAVSNRGRESAEGLNEGEAYCILTGC